MGEHWKLQNACIGCKSQIIKYYFVHIALGSPFTVNSPFAGHTNVKSYNFHIFFFVFFSWLYTYIITSHHQRICSWLLVITCGLLNAKHLRPINIRTLNISLFSLFARLTYTLCMFSLDIKKYHIKRRKSDLSPGFQHTFIDQLHHLWKI